MNQTLKDFFPVKLQMTVNIEHAPRFSIVYPFINVRGCGNDETINIAQAWLQYEQTAEAAWDANRIPNSTRYSSLPPNIRQQVDSDHLRRQLYSRCFGKPISQFQTVSEWQSLDNISLVGNAIAKRANMLGLRELIKAGVLDPGDKGEAFTIESLDSPITLVSVWAESVGAARRKLNEICDAVGHDVVMREHFPAYERDWNE